MQGEPDTPAVIAFPADRRTGHARKVAVHLSKARTNKEADWVLSRALVTYHDKLFLGGISSSEAGRLMDVFRRLIFKECLAINSKWLPAIDDASSHGGAA